MPILSDSLTHLDAVSCRLLPGKVLLELDPIPDQIGSLFLPDTARAQKPDSDSISHTAIVIAVGYAEQFYALDPARGNKLRRFTGVTEADFVIGDRVIFRLILSDLNQRRIITDVRRIDAVIEHSNPGTP